MVDDLSSSSWAALVSVLVRAFCITSIHTVWKHEYCSAIQQVLEHLRHIHFLKRRNSVINYVVVKNLFKYDIRLHKTQDFIDVLFVSAWSGTTKGRKLLLRRETSYHTKSQLDIHVRVYLMCIMWQCNNMFTSRARALNVHFILVSKNRNLQVGTCFRP